MNTKLRWAPTDRQLADVLTKDKAEPADLFRAVLREGTYRISEEDKLLALAKAERLRRQAVGRERREAAEKRPDDGGCE